MFSLVIMLLGFIDHLFPSLESYIENYEFQNPSLWTEDYRIQTHSQAYVFIAIQAVVYVATFNGQLRDFD
jgi:hypothetical protein